MSHYIALVPAAGRGTRFSSGDFKSKQHTSLNGKTLLQHAVEPFMKHEKIMRVILVLAPDDKESLQQIENVNNKLMVRYVGGASRAESVLNGIRSIEAEVNDQDWILVHDAARPLITHELINRLIGGVSEECDGGILAVRAVDTIKSTADTMKISNTLDRNKHWLAQTPQMFRKSILVRALEEVKDLSQITDESSAVEALGMRPTIVESEPSNIKVTYAQDLNYASLLLKNASTRGISS